MPDHIRNKRTGNRVVLHFYRGNAETIFQPKSVRGDVADVTIGAYLITTVFCRLLDARLHQPASNPHFPKAVIHSNKINESLVHPPDRGWNTPFKCPCKAYYLPIIPSDHQKSVPTHERRVLWMQDADALLVLIASQANVYQGESLLRYAFNPAGLNSFLYEHKTDAARESPPDKKPLQAAGKAVQRLARFQKVSPLKICVVTGWRRRPYRGGAPRAP